MLSVFSSITCTNYLVMVTLGLISTSLLYIYFTWNFDKWKKLNVPYVRPILFFGNYLKIAMCIDHPADTYKQIYYKLAGHKYGGLFQMRTPYLMIRDPEMINNILIKDFSYFPNRGTYSDFSTSPITENLFFMKNPKWKIMRNKLSPAFSSGKIKVMLDQMKECSDEMMKYIYKKLNDTSNDIDLRDVFGKFAASVIGTCAFGLKINANSDQHTEFHVYGKTIFQASPRYLMREICLLISPKLLKIARFSFFPVLATKYFHRIFHETISYREENNIIRHDIVHFLIQARKDLVLNKDLPQHEKFTETQITANAFVMYAAGFETITTALSFCMHELSLKKHIQDKVREEIQSKLSEHNGVLSRELLSELPYLDMVIAETLRKYPAVFALFREAVETYHVPNDPLVIEKGQQLIIPIFSLHNDPRYYSDPEVFDPNRFSPEEKAKRPSGVYLPFGEGPRMCIGKRFAEIEIKLALVKVLSEFEVEPCEKTEIPITFSNLSILVIPNNEKVWLKLNKLSD